jgi:hypothetical protein
VAIASLLPVVRALSPEVANQDPVQRPACILRVFVRLEDDGPAEDDEAQSDDEPFSATTPHAAKQLAKLGNQLATARAGHDAKAQAAVQKKISGLQKEVKAEKFGTPSPPGDASDDFFVLKNVIVVPTEVSGELNGFRTADKLTATFPFAALPLTSRVIRSCLVEAYAGTVPATSFASPEDWRLPFDKTTILFRGYADEWKTEHKEGEATVRIEARSMEAILIDQKVNKMAPVYQVGRIEDADTGHVTKLDNELITHYLTRFFSTLPNANGALGGDRLVARFYGFGKEPSVNRKLFIRALQTAKSQNQAQGAPPGQQPPAEPLPTLPPDPGTAEGSGVAKLQQPHAGADTSAWDIVTMACELAGCIPIYDPAKDPDAILVTLPQTVYDDANPSPDGFLTSATDPDSGQKILSPHRLMVWGRNVKEMSTSRKLGKIKSPAIEVVCYNPDGPPGKRQLRARFPGTHKAGRVGAKGKNKTDEVLTQVVHGIRSEEQLMQIAVGLYHSRGRHETSVHIVTDSLTSYRDGKSLPNDPDLLRLRPGTAVKVLVAKFSQDADRGLNLTPLSDAFGQDPEQLRNFLADQFQRHSVGYETADQGLGNLDAVAQRIAAASQLQKTRNLYYVRTICHKFSKDTGWNADMEVVTFARVTTDPVNMSAKDKAINDRLKLPQGKSRASKTTTQVAQDRAARVAGNKELP